MGDGAARYCRVHPCFTLTATPHVRQGHILASGTIGGCYYWGKGVAIDYPRAMAAFKVGAEAGDAVSQHQLGCMYYKGLGVDVDFKQARAWFEKAAAQDHPEAVGMLALMHVGGEGVTSSWRRARELYQRAIELGGSSQVVQNMQTLTGDIQQVQRNRSNLAYVNPTAPPPYVDISSSTSSFRRTTACALDGQAGGDPRHEPRGHER